jgi:hypothetical protein
MYYVEQVKNVLKKKNIAGKKVKNKPLNTNHFFL